MPRRRNNPLRLDRATRMWDIAANKHGRPLLRSMQAEYYRIIEHWDQEKPDSKRGDSDTRNTDFRIHFKAHGRGGLDMGIRVEAPSAAGATKSVFSLLMGGTDVRYARMTKNFIPKTMPGVIGSRPGRGYRREVDTTRKRPGIEPRDWQKMVAEKYFEKEKQVISDMFREWLDLMWD